MENRKIVLELRLDVSDFDGELTSCNLEKYLKKRFGKKLASQLLEENLFNFHNRNRIKPVI